MALFNAVKPELMAAAEAKFKKAQDTTKKESFWSSLAGTATKALASGGAPGSQTGGGGNSQVMAQLLALKDSPTFEQFFRKTKTSGTAGQNNPAPAAANKEMPKEVMAMLDMVTNKAAMDKTMSERCDLFVAEIQKKLASK